MIIGYKPDCERAMITGYKPVCERAMIISYKPVCERAMIISFKPVFDPLYQVWVCMTEHISPGELDYRGQ